MDGNTSLRKKLGGLRLVALIPAVLSGIACVLQIVTVISGSTTSVGQSFPLITFNSSSLSDNLIQFRNDLPAATAARRLGRRASTASTGNDVVDRMLGQIRSVLGTDGRRSNTASTGIDIVDGILTEVGNALGAASSAATTSTTSSLNSTTTTSALNGTTAVGDSPNVSSGNTTAPEAQNGTSLLTPEVGNATASVQNGTSLPTPDASNGTISSAENGTAPAAVPQALPATAAQAAAPAGPPAALSIADITALFIPIVLTAILNIFQAVAGGNLTAGEAIFESTIKAQVGSSNFYSLHILGYCSGALSDLSDPNATVNTTSCTTFSDKFATLANKSQTPIPSSFNVSTSNVTIPALSVVTPAIIYFSQVGTVAIIFLKIFLILTGIFSGVTSLLSFAVVFYPNGHALVQWTMIISQISTQIQAWFSFQFTIQIIVINFLVKKFGRPLGIASDSGGKFLAATWLSFVFTMFAAIYWQITWFVETRRSSFKKRLRTDMQMGDYKGALPELKSDLKRPTWDESDGMNDGLLKSSGPNSDQYPMRKRYSKSVKVRGNYV